MKNVLILGGVIIDKYNMVDRYPAHGTDAFINETFDIPGGCSLNVAVTLKNLGCSPFVFSNIGQDNEGDQILKYMASKDIDPIFINKVDGRTDYCLVVVDKTGERTFLTYEVLDRNISPELLNQMLSMELESVYITGYFMVHTKLNSNTIDLLKALSVRGVQILFDPGAIVGEIDLDVLKTLLKLADIVTPNKFEASVISEKLNIPLKDFVKPACYLISKDGGNDISIFEGSKELVMKAYNADVVDSTGAGDSFAAGVLYGLSTGLDIKESVKIGMACGALTTTFKEPHGNFDKRQIDEIIRNGSVSYDK